MSRLADLTANVLAAAARHGQWLLIVGLVLGVFAPGLARMITPWIGTMIASILFLAALRLGPRQALGVKRDLGQALLGVAALQLMLPIALALLFLTIGWHGVLPTALILMTAAAPLSGSPSLVIMTGHDPAPALRMLTTGIALLPLTVIPVFWLMPELGGAKEVLVSAARLLVVIVIAVATAFALRKSVLPDLSQRAIRSIDGLSALIMGIVVIGLMSAVGTALYEDTGLLALTLVVAFLASFGLQIIAFLVVHRVADRQDVAVPFAVTAGNRNIGLFLAALPTSVTTQVLLFIGCYQIPMYLTPLLLGRLYRRQRVVDQRTASETDPS